MGEVTLSSGFIMSIQVCLLGRYEARLTEAALTWLTRSGARFTGANFYRADPTRATHDDLDEGIPTTVSRLGTLERWRSEINRSVFSDCSFSTRLSEFEVEGRLRAKFHRGPSWVLSVDLPHSPLFEKPGLIERAKIDIWRDIENLSLDLFDSLDCAYGGILFEADLPSVMEVKRGTAHLIDDFAYFPPPPH